MSFNRITAHREDRYVDVVIDGHEDWESATECIAEMISQAEANGLSRFLVDFRLAVMRISPSEGLDIADFFDSFACARFQIAVILPEDSRHAAPARAFCHAMVERGHVVDYLSGPQSRDAWIRGAHPQSGAA